MMMNTEQAMKGCGGRALAANAAWSRRWVAQRWLMCLAWFLCCWLAWGGAWAAEFLEGKVVRVADGDTITLLDAERRQHRIRLKGIDAPESLQAFGEVSRRALAEMIAGQQVAVRADGLDRYGRVIGVVVFAGRDINLEMVRQGMAWHYRQFARDQSAQERQAYAEAERQARAANIGLWSDPHAQPPWEFRRANQSR